MTLQVGDHFDHYQIRSYLARGGTGDVYSAVDVGSGREVALKIPTRETILDVRQYHQFLREVDLMKFLDHPAVQHGVESGRWQNIPFLVTDLIEGRMLRDIIKENGPFPVERAVALTIKIADGMAYCHSQSVIHRDLKPENILVSQDDQPVVIDFGLALTAKGQTSGLSAGTPDYMAPEQIEGHPGDKRTDIYALGIILYELLVGEPPFVGDNLLVVMNKHLHEAVPRLDKIRSDVPLSIVTIVTKCIQRDPGNRYQDMSALICDLDHPNQVDTTSLESLTLAPPKPSFFRTQPGQALLTTAAFIAGIAVLTILLMSLKH